MRRSLERNPVFDRVKVGERFVKRRVGDSRSESPTINNSGPC
jgi:hypothetical protein